jgi:diguanylate cyclase (GGDEF)-like protein/PAS domain S-box-containing protein
MQPRSPKGRWRIATFASVPLSGSYNYRLVGLSVFLSISMSYAGFELTERLMAARGYARRLWLVCGATTMGLALWTSYYLAILAFTLPIPIRYHYPTLALALVTAILLPALGLSATSQERKGVLHAVVASVAVGVGMAAIPFIIAGAMRLPAQIERRWGLVVLSGAFAIVIFLFVLVAVFKVLYMKRPRVSAKVIGAILLGGAVASLPYLCMTTVKFYSSPEMPDLHYTIGRSLLGAAATAGTAFLILAGTVTTSAFEGLLESQEAATEKAQERESFFRNLAEAVPAIVWTAGPNGLIDFASERWYSYSGLPPRIDKEAAWREAVHPDDMPACSEHWLDCIRSGDPYEMEYRLRGSDGNYRWFLAKANPIRDKEGKLVKWFGTVMDIESQKHHQQVLEQQVKERTEQLAEANDHLQEEILERDFAHRKLDEQNEKMLRDLTERTQRATLLAKMGELLQSCISKEEVFAAGLGFAPKIFPSRRGAFMLLNAGRTLAEVAGSWNDCLLPVAVFEPNACWALRTGHPHLVIAGDTTARCAHAVGVEHTYLCVPILAQGEALGILHFQATDQAPALGDSELSFKTTFAGQVGLSVANIRLREALRSQSIKDPLTGLYNRRYLTEMLERETRRCVRAEQSLSLLMLDLDHFKKFNDTYGHDAGDAVLRETASFLSRSIRAEDIVCRFGGEEFVVILPTADLNAAHARAERIRSKLHELTVLHQGQSLGMITLSIGVAALPLHGTSPKELLAAADAALYRAKREGRDRVVMAEPPSEAETQLTIVESGKS